MITIAFAELKTPIEGSPDSVVPETLRPGRFDGPDSVDFTADMAADSFVSFMLEQTADPKKPEPAMGQSAEIAQTHGEGGAIRIERAEALLGTVSGQAAMTVEVASDQIAASDQTNITVKPHSGPANNGRSGVKSTTLDAVFIKEHDLSPGSKPQAALVSSRLSTVISGQMPIQNSSLLVPPQVTAERARNASPTEATDPIAPVSATATPDIAVAPTADKAYLTVSDESAAPRFQAPLQAGTSGGNDLADTNRKSGMIRKSGILQTQATAINPAREMTPLVQPEQPGSVSEMATQQSAGQARNPLKAIETAPAESGHYRQVSGKGQPMQEIAVGKTWPLSVEPPASGQSPLQIGEVDAQIPQGRQLETESQQLAGKIKNTSEPVKYTAAQSEAQRLVTLPPDRRTTFKMTQPASGTPNRQTAFAGAQKTANNPPVSMPAQIYATDVSTQTSMVPPDQVRAPSQAATGHPGKKQVLTPLGTIKNQHPQLQPKGEAQTEKRSISVPERAHDPGVVSSPQMADEPPRGLVTSPNRQPLPRQAHAAVGRSHPESDPEIAARAMLRPSIRQNRDIIQDTQASSRSADRDAPAVVVQQSAGHAMPGKMPQNGGLAQVESPPGGFETPGFAPHSEPEPQQDESMPPRPEMADFNKNRSGQEAWFTMNPASKLPQAEIGLASPGLLDHGQPEIGHSELHLSELTGIEPARMSPDISTARPEMARHVAQQLTDVVRQMPDRPVEVTLNPEELGRVRLTFTISENGINLAVLSERGETMDLLRRHIDILAQEFREMGYQDVSFDFSSQSQHQAHDQDGDANPTDHLGASVLEHDQPASPKPSQQPASGLDLRL